MQEVSAYERRRLDNIAANEASLRELGLLGEIDDNPPLKKPRVVKKPKKTPVKLEPRGKSERLRKKPQFLHPSAEPVKVRRSVRSSSRLASKPDRVIYTETKDSSIDAIPEEVDTIKLERVVPVKRLNEEIKVEYSPGSSIIVTPLHRDQNPRSIRDIDARFTDMQGQWLGKVMMPPEGSNSFKLTVVEAISTSKPRFSKYSGIQEFQNGIVLFVNATREGEGGYENCITVGKSGLYNMPWFAQQRHTSETPVIKRLLDHGETVTLMCRIPGEAYVSCGRLVLKSAHLEESPIKLVWVLAHSKVLEGCEGWNKLLEYVKN